MKRLLLSLFLSFPLLAQAQSTIICTVQNEAMQTVTPINGWATGDFGNSPGMFYKDVNGIVRLQGLIFKFTGPVDETAFIMPVGYRPAKPQWFTVMSPSGPAVLIFHPTGEVQITVSFGYFTYVSLANVSYLAQ